MGPPLVEYDIDPLSLAILLSVYNGIKSPERIAEYLNVDSESVKEAMKELEEKGLLRREKKKFLIFESEDIKLTREGYNTLMVALERLKPKLEKVRELAASGREDEAIALLGAMGLGLLAPLLLPLILGGLFLPVAFGGNHNASHIHPGEPF